MEEHVVVAAPAERVWTALTDPDDRRRWWSYLDLDARVGGELCERWQAPDGSEAVTRGTVVEVDPPRRLRTSWADDGWPAPTEVEVTLTPAGAGTEVRVRHTGWDALPGGDALAAAHREGWRAHLANLARHVTEG